MQNLKINTGFEEIILLGNNVYNGHDFFINANALLKDVEVLFFFDSRGISKNWETSLIKMLLEYFHTSKYLAVVRPLELTTWATLYNFLHQNRIDPDLIITNVGIVDCTPKKYLHCQSMVEQIIFSSEGLTTTIQPLEEYKMSNGEMEMLFTLNYSELYKLQLKNFFSTVPLFAIKTPLVDPNITIDRKRPLSFFTQLHKTNELIDLIVCKSIDLGFFDNQLTYDAVHWTQEGNKFVFDKIVNQI